MHDTILFLDFDGTITSEETLDGAMRLCIDADLYEEKLRELREGKRTLADTLRLAFEYIPSGRLQDILDYVRGVPVRPGFEALLDDMAALGIPVVVVSGGLKPYIEEKLAPYRDRLLGVHSVSVDASGPFLKLHSEAEADGEIMQKTLVMQKYAYKNAICAGDSHTDVRMAKASQTVFARDLLARLLTKQGVPFIEWNDFYDISRAIKSSR